MISILLKISHHASSKLGSIGTGPALYLVGSIAFQGILTICHFFVMKLCVSDGTSLEKRCSFYYAYLASRLDRDRVSMY